MISISTPQPGELYYLVDLGVRVSQVTLNLAIPTRRLAPDRVINFDYLNQGAAVDRLKNKPVQHLEVDGNLSVVDPELIIFPATNRRDLVDIFSKPRGSSSTSPVDPLCWTSVVGIGGLDRARIYSIPVTSMDLSARQTGTNYTFGFTSSGEISLASLNPVGYPLKVTWNYDYETCRLKVVFEESVKVSLNDILPPSSSRTAYYQHDVLQRVEIPIGDIQGDRSWIRSKYERIGRCPDGYCVNIKYNDWSGVSTQGPSESGTDQYFVRLVRYDGSSVNLTGSPLNAFAIQQDLAEASALTAHSSGLNTVWSELMLEAMHDSTYLDNNMSMFIKDIVSMKDDFQNLNDAGVKLGNDAVKAVSKSALTSNIAKWEKKHGRRLAKDVCNVYLPLIYGYALTFDEAVAMGERLAEKRGHWSEIFDLYQARKSKHLTATSKAGNFLSVKASYLANLQCKDNAFSQLYSVLQHTGLQIGLKDAWDWIPYSFCIDWVYDVSNILDAIDCKGWQCNYDLVSCVKSRKTTFDYNVDNMFVSNELSACVGQTLAVEYYERWIEFDFDPPPFLTGFDVFETIETLWSHRTEGAALILQRLF